MIAATFLLAYFLYEDSIMLVDYGNTKERFFIPFYERDNTKYEDSELFNSLFDKSVEDIVRMSVIKNQMETRGVYDPDKAVDIISYANRNQSYHLNTQRVEYRLDDLINWGNKGIEYVNVSSETVPFDVAGDSIQIVVPRYKTVEGKDLLSYAASEKEYEDLVKNGIYNRVTEKVENESEESDGE